jgi:osmotically-inducible protein OsmY
MDERSLETGRAAAPTHSGDHPLPETLAEAEQLAASIEEAVSRETGGRVRNLRVEVDRQGVTLTGRCTTFYTKQRAQHAAMAFPGGHPLSNQIEVT